MFVLLTFNEIQYIPVIVEMINTISPVILEIRTIIIARKIKTIIERFL